MNINWIGYYTQYDGYGRFSSRMVQALQRLWNDVIPLTRDDIDKPDWMLQRMRVQWHNLTISCTYPSGVRKIPGNGPHWLFTMCESSIAPKSTSKYIRQAGIERLLVPCEHNVEAFRRSGVKIPISVVPLGVNPEEFPQIVRQSNEDRPYTFLTIADRSSRKGWQEVYTAFYKAFSGKQSDIQDVRLIIKCLPNGNGMVDLISKSKDLDKRIQIDISTYDNIADFYRQGDCLVLPSRSEGWGLPHREAAMMGLPVIVQKYAGLDDGHTEEWAIPVDGGKMTPIMQRGKVIGEWLIADTDDLAAEMFSLYQHPDRGIEKGIQARFWLAANQTWLDSAGILIDLILEGMEEDGDVLDYSTRCYREIN